MRRAPAPASRGATVRHSWSTRPAAIRSPNSVAISRGTTRQLRGVARSGCSDDIAQPASSASAPPSSR